MPGIVETHTGHKSSSLREDHHEVVGIVELELIAGEDHHEVAQLLIDGWLARADVPEQCG